ncbi:DUF2934 domain-containing protein [Stakelama sp. CBK3Z-3]|uniref:DUF2934 domain-containing protein n=1 Tax=Stakelama flava TaxID=2860338 RepID=A0ABS6XHH5_9SPHN|nr:DUF2934 domain-containing protein [Stakelama flava]MBW4329278.1 DUF2934 domain-containing protein [Stakelama flava]
MTQGDELEQRIRDRAYAIWQEEGEPHGRSEEHWAKARAEFENAVAKGAKSPPKSRAPEAPAKPVKAKSAHKKAATSKPATTAAPKRKTRVQTKD